MKANEFQKIAKRIMKQHYKAVGCKRQPAIVTRKMKDEYLAIAYPSQLRFNWTKWWKRFFVKDEKKALVCLEFVIVHELAHLVQMRDGINPLTKLAQHCADVIAAKKTGVAIQRFNALIAYLR